MADIDALHKVAPKDLPSPPFILLPGLPNLRDIGGYPLQEGPSAPTSKRSIRRGLVFRAADTSAVPRFPDSCTALTTTLGIRTVYDLRSTAEVTRGSFGPPLALPGLTRVHAPTNKEDMSPEAMSARYREYAHGGDEGFARAYASILASAGPAVAAVAHHLLERPADPILVHCTAGKDRTAIVVMLLLSLAGCSDKTIADEYALTTQGLQGIREAIVEQLLKRPDMAGDRAAAERMTGSRAPAMLQTLAMLRRDYDGAEGWLRTQAGLSADECAQLRDVLTSDEEPIFTEPA